MSVPPGFIKLYFILAGVLGAIALTAQFISDPNILNYFSFFTILSNIAAAALFIYIGISKTKISPKFHFLFGAVTSYMGLTGLGYWLLLRNEPVPIPWINIVLHGVTPITVTLGWLIFKNHYKMSYSTVLKWLYFPILYLIYALMRGFATNWYAYPFLDPSKVGTNGVIFHIFLLSGTVAILGTILIFIANHLAKTTK